MDPFLTTENVACLQQVMGTRWPGNQAVRHHMTSVLNNTGSCVAGATDEARLRALNAQVIMSIRNAADHKPHRQHTSVTTDYIEDEMIVVVAAGDRTDSLPTDPYEFTVRLNTDPSTPGLTIDGTVKYCTSVEPVAAFIPVSAGVRDEPFLVLQTDVSSRNRLMSTQHRISGTNVVMVPPTPAQSLTYDRYSNLTGTSLRPTEPQRRLATMKLRLMRSDGSTILPTGAATPTDTNDLPRLVLKLRARVPRSIR